MGSFDPKTHALCCSPCCVYAKSLQSCLMSDSWRPHGLSPTRLLCPWDSPVKNTGVGCSDLFQGIILTQGLNLHLLHCRQILYRWVIREAPFTMLTAQQTKQSTWWVAKNRLMKESLFNTDFTLTKLCQGRFRLQYCSAPCQNTFSWIDIDEMKTNLHAIKVLLKGLEFGTKIHRFPSGAVVKKKLCNVCRIRLQEMQETQVQSLDQKASLEKELATHSSILAWEVPWTEEPSGLQSMASQRVRHDSVIKQQPGSTTMPFFIVQFHLIIMK